MATFHRSLKSGKPGSAVPHAQYITRAGYRSRGGRNDLVATGHGNLPAWAGDDPAYFWKFADKYERVNGSAYKEYVLALPNELNSQQQLALVDDFIAQSLAGKSYLFAVHRPIAALGQVPQPHAHVMFSERLPDNHDRTPHQHFRRFNPDDPSKGGCRKDGCGLNKEETRDSMRSQRERWAQLQNEHLQRHGHEARVDHRSLRERKIDAPAPQHLGPARVRALLRVQAPHGASTSNDVLTSVGTT